MLVTIFYSFKKGRAWHMKSPFTEDQITKILSEHKEGKRVAYIVREHIYSEQTFYRWKIKYARIEVNEAKLLKQAWRRKPPPKELVADLLLDIRILKDMLSKNGYTYLQAWISFRTQEEYQIRERQGAGLWN